jgi:hypothetical protein
MSSALLRLDSNRGGIRDSRTGRRRCPQPRPVVWPDQANLLTILKPGVANVDAPTMLCSRCARPVVKVNFQGVSSFSLRSCSNDHRVWSVNGQTVELADVIESVRLEREALKTVRRIDGPRPASRSPRPPVVGPRRPHVQRLPPKLASVPTPSAVCGWTRPGSVSMSGRTPRHV